MPRIFFIILSFFAVLATNGQPVFRTIAPAGPITMGESFVVQYVVDATQISGFSIPSYYPFRVVDGPNEYTVKNQQQGVKNLVYTFTATTSGRFTLPRAMGKYKGRNVYSEAQSVEVLSAADALQAEQLTNNNQALTTLKPGQDTEAFIKDNIFLKVDINRPQCYIGQPVIATYRLYSALQSESDVEKNPVFYGFTALDMVNLQDNVTSTETIRGKVFTVYLIRKVQLYPIQSGRLRIDPLELATRIDLHPTGRPATTIKEGGAAGQSAEQKGQYQTIIRSPELFLDVKPLPSSARPDAFEGAVGEFNITAELSAPQLARNEEGQVTITINGEGNFTQIAAPAIAWPKGVEGFDSSVIDKLDKTLCPISGSRSFRYSFVSNTAGEYTIPSISFVFFDSDGNRYKTVATKPLRVKIDNRVKETAPKLNSYTTTGESRSWWLITAILLILAAAIGVLMWKNKKQDSVDKAPKPVRKPVELFLETAKEHIHQPAFYQYLQSGIWQFLGERYQLAGSSMNKQNLLTVLTAHRCTEEDQQQVLNLLKETETGMYTQASLEHDREELLQHAEQVMRKLDKNAS